MPSLLRVLVLVPADVGGSVPRQALLPLQQIKVLPHYSSRRNKCLGPLKFSNARYWNGRITMFLARLGLSFLSQHMPMQSQHLRKLTVLKDLAVNGLAVCREWMRWVLDNEGAVKS